MKFFVLWGKERCGKTTTLQYLAGLLSENFTNLVKVKNPKIELPFCLERDNCYMVEYRGIKIGITTHGDAESLIEEDVKWLSDCDLCLCASRTKGKTGKYIEKQAGEDDIYWIRKTSFSKEENAAYVETPFVKTQQKILNKQQAKAMLQIIDGLIDEALI